MSDIELTEVRAAHRIDEQALEQYLQQHIADYAGPLSLQQFEGGQSNPTYKLTTPGRAYVLRKQPPGELLPSAHQVDREYRVMHALRDTDVPVPRMFCLCEDKTVIGTSFYVMEFVEGRVFTDLTMPASTPDERREVYLQLASVLGRLHSVTPESVGLEEFGRPGNYYARQINRWSKQYLASATEDIPAMSRLMEWLPDNIPQDDASGIVHGDFRLGNVLVHPSEAGIIAVLDWELSTLGHPLGDLAYLCQPYHGISTSSEGLPDNYTELGIPTEDEMLATYCKSAGRERIDNWPFYLVFNAFRSASIIQGVYKRGLDGNASSDKALSFQHVARQLAESGWEKVND